MTKIEMKIEGMHCVSCAFDIDGVLEETEGVKKAQGTLKFAILGLILFVSAYLILNIICVLFLGGFGSSCKLFKLEIPGP